MMWSSTGVGWGAWIIMTAGMLGLWALTVLAVTAVIRSDHDERPGWPRAPRYEDPLRLLDERFVRGEIDLEDYQARRELLSKP